MIKRFTLIFLSAAFTFLSVDVPHSYTAEDILFEEIPVVYSVSKAEEAVTDAPATTYILTEEQIRERGYTNLGDVFEDLPGMQPIKHYFSEVGDLIPVRGVQGNNNIIFLINGMRVNPPGGEEMPIRSDFSVEYVERIEVAYGPASTMWGQDAISGVVNIITKDPGTDEVEASIEHGTFGHSKVSVGMSKYSDTLDITGYVQYFDTDLSDFSKTHMSWYEDRYHREELNNPGERWDTGLNAFARVGYEDTSLQLWYRNSSRSSSEGAFTNPGEDSDAYLYFASHAIWEDSSLVTELSNQMQLNENIALDSILTYNRYEIDPKSRYVFPQGREENIYELQEDAAVYELSEWDFKYGKGESITLEERVSAPLTDNISLSGGVEVSYFDILPKCTVAGGLDPDVDNAEKAATDIEYWETIEDAENQVAETKKTVEGANRVNYTNMAAYAEGDITLTDELSLVLGGRMDVNSRYDEVPFSPRAALIYSPMENLFLKAMYNRAFVAVAPYYEYATFDNGGQIQRVNDDLEPEETESYELSALYYLGGLAINAAVYQNNHENLLHSGDSGLEGVEVKQVWRAEGSTRTLTQSINEGESTATGFDLFANYSMDMVSLWGSYSYVDYEAEIEGQDRELEGLSHHNVRLGATVEPIDGLNITNSLMWRSDLENKYVGDDFEYLVENPYRWDMYISCSVNENMDVFVDLKNVTDNSYGLSGIYDAIPQEPFKATVGLNYRM